MQHELRWAVLGSRQAVESDRNECLCWRGSYRWILMPVLTRRNRELMFWLVQALGWSGIFISQWLGTLASRQPEILQTIPLISLAGFLISSPLRYICRWLWRRPLPVMIIGSLVSAYAASVAWRVCGNTLYANMASSHFIINNWTFYFGGAVSGTYLMTGRDG